MMGLMTTASSTPSLSCQELASRIAEASLLRGEFTLRSGRKSSYYLDKYLFSTQPDILHALGLMFAERIAALPGAGAAGVTKLAGAELGGIPLVCAAVGCPTLRNEAYRADRIDAQLDDQTRYVHTHDRWFKYQSGAGEVYLTKLYKWYGADFKQTAGSVLAFAARYSSALKRAIEKDEGPRIKWLDYDWKLNDRTNRG